MSYQGASNFRRLRGDYFGNSVPQSPASGLDPAGYQPAPDLADPASYQAADGYQGSSGYLSATGRLQRPAGPAPAGYESTAVFQVPAGYQSPAGYQAPAAYQNPGGYQDPAAYQDAAGWPGPAGYADPNAGFPDPTAYQGLTGPPFTGTAPPDPATAGWEADVGRAPRGRGILAGAVTGFLSGASAIGVAVLAAAFVRPQASPVIAAGGAAIDRTPSALKQFAIQYFGQNDKNVLLLGMYVVIAMLAMAIGLLARKRLAVGVAGMAAFGAFGAFVAMTRPEGRATDGIPSLIGGVAGVAALVLLVWAAAPPMAAVTRRTRDGYRRAGHASARGAGA
jgi:hypothetical protein